MLKLMSRRMFPRKADPAQDLPVFCIVTPVYNGSAYIDDTIYSVLSQAGEFVLHYHVQDGGSTDDTMDRVRHWMKLAGGLPKLCRRLVFTCSSGPDAGMYDAINKGFAAALPAGDDVVMGWIAADDRVAPGACATILGIRAAFPDVRFLGGRVSLLDGTGSIIGVHPIYPFSRRCMAAGLYDGRALPFIMQEGSFWCADLWRAVGGLDTRFRLAGDWDLWRRMAAHERYVVADTILGFHRRRPGQLSEQMDRYYDEVDRLLDAPGAVALPEVLAGGAEGADAGGAAPLRAAYDGIAAEYEVMRTDAPRFRASAHAATVVRFNLQHKLWERTHGFGTVAVAPELVTVAGATGSNAVLPKAGFAAPEGPYPEFGMPAPIRWMSGPRAEGEVTLAAPGRYRVVIRCRSWTRQQSVTILADGRPLGRLAVNAHGHDRDIQLSAEATLAAGTHVIGVAVDQPFASDRLLLFIDWTIEQLPSAEGPAVLPARVAPIALAARAGLPPAGTWPRISIVVPTRNQGHFIRDTLDSILAQAYPNLELIVADGGSTDATPLILREYAPHITHLIAEPDRGQSDAINKGMRAAGGDILTWLNSDDLLADGALHAVAHAFMTSDADMVAGVCELFDDGNHVLHRHLPCLAEGALPLADLLDIENRWLRGQFFHQPEVFFRRRIWERAGGAVDESLFYSMDYDLWVRMARAGATIRVIGAPLARFRMHAAQKTSGVEVYKPELVAHAARLRGDLGLGALPAAAPVRHRLRIVFFNDYGFKYGAGIAHGRLAAALAAAGHEIVALAYADFDHGALAGALDAGQVAAAILAERPDLVLVGNLHTVARDFDLLGALLPTGVPTLFYAHDQWIATGGSPYPEMAADGAGDSDAADAHAAAQGRKRAMLAAAREGRFAILTNSGYMQAWLGEALAATGAPPIHVAPIGIDTAIYAPGDRRRARMVLDLPQDRFIVLTAAAALADARKGLPLLLEALEGLADKGDVLLLIMGFGAPLADLSFEVRHTGYLADEDLVALHYQAADLFVGPSIAEAFGQTYVEAGACGVPSVAFAVGGVGDAVIDGMTGLLARAPSAAALRAAIARLRGDPALRRRMGAQARLHVRNRFSLEASAARLVAILAGEPALGLDLAPTVTLAATPEPPSAPRYLVPPANPPAYDATRWIPCENLVEETITPEPGGLPPRYWWATWPSARIIVRTDGEGPHTLRLNVRCAVPGQRIAISVNCEPEQLVEITSADLDVVHRLRVPVDLVKGLNRVDIRFAVFHQEDTGTRRCLTLLFEDVGTLPGAPGAQGGPKDGACELVAGFADEEGPYPDMALPNPFHWALGQRSKLRIFSAIDGERLWELKIRNARPDQRITVKVDNATVLTRALEHAALERLAVIRFAARVDVGFHVVTIESSRQESSEGDPRPMAFIFEGLRLCEPDRIGETPALVR